MSINFEVPGKTNVLINEMQISFKYSFVYQSTILLQMKKPVLENTTQNNLQQLEIK